VQEVNISTTLNIPQIVWYRPQNRKLEGIDRVGKEKLRVCEMESTQVSVCLL